VTRAADRALGASLAAGAWAFALATYPAALLFAYRNRFVFRAFESSLAELAESWESRQDGSGERAA
jgi:hypothetical protein